MDDQQRHENGMRVRREVLGDEYVEGANAKITDTTRDFQDFITRVAWGDVWTREGLDRRTRSVVTLSILAALGRDDELVLHLKAAQNNGLRRSEIAEVFLHTAVYAGVPAANRALALLEADGPAPDEASAPN